MNLEQFYRENYRIVYGYRGILDYHFPTDTIFDLD